MIKLDFVMEHELVGGVLDPLFSTTNTFSSIRLIKLSLSELPYYFLLHIGHKVFVRKQIIVGLSEVTLKLLLELIFERVQVQQVGVDLLVL